MTYQSINPNDGKLIKSFEHLSNVQLENALAVAENCFQTWKHTIYAERAESFLAPDKLNPQQGAAHMESPPLGVLFCVEPWNFPYYQLARVAGSQLMAGNVLVVKHAGCVPQCAIAFEKLLRDAGAPVGAYTNLLISYEQSDRVIDVPRVKGVALTGRVEAGRRVAARAGQNLNLETSVGRQKAVQSIGVISESLKSRATWLVVRDFKLLLGTPMGCADFGDPTEVSRLEKSTMELVGSDAFTVLDDADLDQVIPWAVWGHMYNAGQTCCAAKRFIVLDSVADAFLARFKAALEALQPGDPMDEKTTLGPLSTETALRQLLAQLDAAVKGGAKLLLGGKRIDRPGWFMQPTILTDIDPTNPAFRDEFFGPVVSFFRVKNDEEAIALANDSDFGLGGSVWTKDEARGLRVASRVDAGMLFVNNLDWADAELPFGGIKHSGYGRELGGMGIQEFVNKKLVRSGHIAAPV